MPEDERGTVARLKRGDEAAFDQVYASFRPRLFSFLARLSRQPALAEDLLQETFVRLARAAPKLDDDTRLAPWLFTVARNLYVSHRRWAVLDVARLSELRLWSKLRRPEPTAFELCAAGEDERRLERAIADLPARYREVVLLVGVERLSPAEAAGVLGIEPAALRQRLARARAMMRAVFEQSEA